MSGYSPKSHGRPLGLPPIHDTERQHQIDKAVLDGQIAVLEEVAKKMLERQKQILALSGMKQYPEDSYANDDIMNDLIKSLQEKRKEL